MERSLSALLSGRRGDVEDAEADMWRFEGKMVHGLQGLFFFFFLFSSSSIFRETTPFQLWGVNNSFIF